MKLRCCKLNDVSGGTHQIFTCPKSAIEVLEKCVKYVQCLQQRY